MIEPLCIPYCSILSEMITFDNINLFELTSYHNEHSTNPNYM